MSPSGALADLLGSAIRVGTIRIGKVAGVFVDESGAASYERLGARAIRESTRLAGLCAAPSGHLERVAVSTRAPAGTRER